MDKRLTHIDLFTGAAGFSLALFDTVRTVAYCDISPLSRKLLLGNIKRGLLTSAPILGDVRFIDKNTFPNDFVANVVTAGFPCQDISSMNRRKEGVRGPRSGLYIHVPRIAHIVGANIIIMENSPLLSKRGLDLVLRKLSQFGFTKSVWGIYSAAQVGAPHERRRLYILAVKEIKSTSGMVFYMTENLQKRLRVNPWDYHHPPRIIEKNQKSLIDIKQRGFLLGNSIVPLTAVYAIYNLGQSILSGDRGKIENAPTLKEPSKQRLHISIPPEKRTGDIKDYHLRKWDTPLATWWFPCNIGSIRAVRILPNEIMYEKETLKYMKQKKRRVNVDEWTINPEFIEWMMGYPLGWTKSLSVA